MHEDVNKRKADHLSPNADDVQKRYLWSPEALLQKNKYYPLRSQVSDAVPSTSQNNEPTADISPKLKIPPIFISPVNYKEMITDLKKLTKNEFITKTTSDRIRINLKSSEDYRTVSKFFKDNNISFYTYQDPTTKPLSIVIKNVPPSITDEDIKTELVNLDLPIIKVNRLLNKNRTNSLVVAVELVNNDEAKNIFKIEKLCYAIVRIEPRKHGNNIPQCYRCQQYGHTKNYCQMEPRCVKCDGNHFYKNCTKPEDAPPKCVNCKMAHPANYRGCSYFTKHSNPNQNNTRRARPATTNNIDIAPNQYPLRFPRTYAEAAGSNLTPPPNFTPSQNPTQNSILVENILNIIFSFITPYITQIKNFFMSNLLPSIFNGQP